MMRARALLPLVAVVALAFAGAAGAAKKKEPTAEEIVEQALSKGAVGFKQGTASIQITIYTP